MRATRPSALLLSAMLLALASSPAWPAAKLLVDLSDDEIAITTGFTGTELLLFGVKEERGDVVVVLRGPVRDAVVRRRERIAGVWVNRESVVFRGLPAYYRVASNRPIEEIAAPGILAANGITAGTLDVAGAADIPAARRAPFRDGLIRNKTRQGLYGYDPTGVAIQGGRLFRTTATFPANVPTGPYRVDVYLFDRGKLAARRESTLVVRKVGLGAEVFGFAHRQATLYGIIAIVVAVAAGWFAGVVFRR